MDIAFIIKLHVLTTKVIHDSDIKFEKGVHIHVKGN